MSVENTYLPFIPAVEPTAPPSPEDLWFIFKENALLVEKKDTVFSIPCSAKVDEIQSKLAKVQYLGAYKGSACYLGEIDKEVSPPENLEFCKLRPFMLQSEDSLFFLAGKA